MSQNPLSQDSLGQTPFEIFAALHQQDQPLVLANAWDAGSALLCQNAGAQAVATSSAGVAWARGYADGTLVPHTELLDTVVGIQRVLNLPLSVDLEAGYSDDPAQVAKLVMELADLDVVGINLEDGDDDPELLIAKIKAIRDALGSRGFFINARIDVYLHQLKAPEDCLQESLARALRYQEAGTSGVFIPAILAADEIQQAVNAIDVPLNVLALPGLPSYQELAQMGVKRVSAGSGPFLTAFYHARHYMQSYHQGQWLPRPDDALLYPEMNQLVLDAQPK